MLNISLLGNGKTHIFCCKILYFFHGVQTLVIHPMKKATIVHLGTAWVSHGKHNLKISIVHSQPLIFLLLFKLVQGGDH